MTNHDALAEARRRWGREAWAHEWYRPAPTDGEGDIRCFEVGYDGPGDIWITVGVGETWDAAFANADRREQMTS